MSKQTYIISIYTENNVGILNRITIIFTRRHINIESITVCPSEIEGVHRYTIVIYATEDMVKKLVGQIEKQIEVIQAFHHTQGQIIPREVALYKISTRKMREYAEFEKVIKQNKASIVSLNEEFAIVEKTGTQEDTSILLESLKPFGMLQFVRSGLIAVTHNPMHVSKKIWITENKLVGENKN